MQSIPASSDGSVVGLRGEISSVGEGSAGSREPPSSLVMKQDPTREKSLFATDNAPRVAEEDGYMLAGTGIDIIRQNKPYQKRSDKLFVAECSSPAGEKIYVGMELIEKKNMVAAQMYAGNSRSLVRCVATVLEQALREKQLSEKTEKRLALLGIWNLEHVRKLTEQPSKHGSFHNRGEEIMESVHGAALGFSPSANGMQYLTYASSKPIPDTGLFSSLPRECDLAGEDDLLQFFRESYGNLIMSVVSRLSNDGETLENRGILRNPIFILKGSFREIAIPVIHGFSALIAANEFGRTKFLVRALAEMHNMMKRALPVSEFISPVSEQATFHKENYLEAKLDGLQKKFIAMTPLSMLSTEPEISVREKKD